MITHTYYFLLFIKHSFQTCVITYMYAVYANLQTRFSKLFTKIHNKKKNRLPSYIFCVTEIPAPLNVFTEIHRVVIMTSKFLRIQVFGESITIYCIMHCKQVAIGWIPTIVYDMRQKLYLLTYMFIITSSNCCLFFLKIVLYYVLLLFGYRIKMVSFDIVWFSCECLNLVQQLKHF